MSFPALADRAPALPGAQPSRWRARRVAPVAVLALVGALLAFRRAEAPYADTDILWGVRSGTDILSGSGLPRTDQYSWTMHGSSWQPNSWAWNVVLGVAYRMGGFVGIALLGIVVLAGTGALLGIALRRAGASGAWGALVAQISLGLLSLFLYPRAQLADYAAVVAIPLLLRDALDVRRPRTARRAVIGLVALQVVWMNLHTTAVLGPVMVAVAGVTLVVRQPRPLPLRRLAVLIGTTCAACLATPYGVAPITHLEEVRTASVGLISEWRPAGFGSTEQLLAVGALVLGAVAAVVAWRRRAFDTFALLVLFGAATGAALRFAPILMLTAIPPLAAAAGRIPARPEFVRRVCAVALAVLAVVAVAGVPRFADPGLANTSPTLVAALPRNCRLVNDMAIGGAVILHRADVMVSIDSRNDMYGRHNELVQLSVLGDAAYGRQYVTTNHVTCVLAPSGAPLVRSLESDSAWRVAAHDQVRTLMVRADT